MHFDSIVSSRNSHLAYHHASLAAERSAALHMSIAVSSLKSLIRNKRHASFYFTEH